MDSHALFLFVAAGLLLNLTPGPDVVYIVTNALRGGWRAGAVASLGITAGCFVHIFAAALGVSALIAASATAFTVLKWIGAAYLLWMGVRMLLSKAPTLHVEAADAQPRSMREVFLQGFYTNALNPKVALFFLAFLPQFIAPDAGNQTMAFLLLGLLFNFNGLWVNFGWAAAAAWFARRLTAVRRGLHGLERVAGAMFVGFGLKLALSDPPTA